MLSKTPNPFRLGGRGSVRFIFVKPPCYYGLGVAFSFKPACKTPKLTRLGVAVCSTLILRPPKRIRLGGALGCRRMKRHYSTHKFKQLIPKLKFCIMRAHIKHKMFDVLAKRAHTSNIRMSDVLAMRAHTSNIKRLMC